MTRDRGHAAEFVSRLSRAHGPALVRFLAGMLGRRELAEEIAQDAYLKLYRLCRPDEVNCPQALLFDVATKLALTHLRRARAEAAIGSAALPVSEAADVTDEAPWPDRRAMADEAIRCLGRIIEELTPNLRDVFVMRYVQQMSRAEVAAQLGVSVGAVEQRLTRALAHCRNRLVELGLDSAGLV